jgi:SAM-dependent methyltransferase
MTMGTEPSPRPAASSAHPSASYGEDYYAGYTRRALFSSKRVPHKEDSYRFWLHWLRSHLAPGSQVLEVGCGPGHFGRLLASPFDYHGIDISPFAVKEARERYGLGSVSLGSAERLEFQDGEMDAVVAFDVVEHLPEPGLFFTEANRVLREGGLLIVTTPNPDSLGNRIKSPGTSNPPSMYLDQTHVSLLSRKDWLRLLEPGFRTIAAGTDFIWDIPYIHRRLLWLEKALLIPLKRLFNRQIGFINWGLGENTVIICRKKAGNA